MAELEPGYNASLSNHMLKVLADVVATFADAGVVLPDRRYVTFGQPVHDMEQVTVSFQQMYLGPPGDQMQTPQKGTAPRSVVLLVEIARCIPGIGNQGAPPDVADLNANAVVQGIDAWLLVLAGVVHATYSGVLIDVTVTVPMGDFQAVSMSLIMSVE